ncbi:MAG: UPF0149 family protein [Chromatiales bacterium]|nr:UPF0149 family protein [Chromatiales bacterium]
MTDFDTLQAALERVDAETGAAEGHGALCGMLSLNHAIDVGRWIDTLLEQGEAGDALVGEARRQLLELYEQTQRSLDDSNLDFALLLPDDDEPLELRVRALAEWCQGFLYGLAMAGYRAGDELPEDTAEFVKDLNEIARASFEVGTGEEDETAYAEVSEYVRMGVLMVNEEMQPSKAPPRLH